jgi:hypothetical protein
MQEKHSEAGPKTQLTSPTQPWSEVLPIYPAAQELFDPLSNTELQELAKNIKANGVCTPAIIYREDSEMPLCKNEFCRCQSYSEITKHDRPSI